MLMAVGFRKKPAENKRMTEDRDKWRKYVHGVANPRIEDGLSQVHTSNNVKATLSNATMSNVASTLLLVWTGLYEQNRSS